MWGSASPRKLERLWHIDRVDFALSVITALMVLAFDLLPAMITGIVFSIIYLIYRFSFPGRAELGRVAQTGDYEAIAWQYGRRHGHVHPEASATPGVIICRLAAPLIFSNAEAFLQTGRELLIEAGKSGSLPHTMVLDCEEILYVDATGADAIIGLFAYAKRYNVELNLARAHSGTYKLLQLAGVVDQIGEENFYDTVRRTVDVVTAQRSTAENGNP